MSIFEICSLFGIMVVLAAIPSTNVTLVVTRSITSGVGSGIAVAAGIVLGDLVYIMLAILGLSVVAESIGSLFMVTKYLGASYLLWLGFSLLKAQDKTTITVNKTREKSNLIASLIAGFILTLGDIKAIVFYASLFPLFIDLSILRLEEILIVILITVISVGGVKVFYALFAVKVANFAREIKFENAARKTAGSFMIWAGALLILKT